MSERSIIAPGFDDALDVRYDFQPFEPMTREHPGCPAEVTLLEVKANGTWTDAKSFTDEFRAQVEATILEEIEEESEPFEPEDCEDY